jgi:hypothetical protein
MFFTFLFFMLKISRIIPCEYNKSCSIFHNESNKIYFAFFWIFYNFLYILQISANWIYYWRCNFATRPLERFRTTQLGPSTHGTAGSPEIWRLRRRSWPGKGSGGPQAHLGRVGARRLGGEGTNGGVRRWLAATAAAARAAAKFRVGKFNVQP